MSARLFQVVRSGTHIAYREIPVALPCLPASIETKTVANHVAFRLLDPVYLWAQTTDKSVVQTVSVQWACGSSFEVEMPEPIERFLK